ncbi:MAG TPA: type II toxin-antitoxin system VapC family toxin [Gemmatimonadaceae bacterium]
MYVIDTNIYVRALRDPAFAPRLDAFVQTALPRLRVSAVVAFEIAVGAEDDVHATAYERWLLRPFRARGRVLAPDAGTWRLVARMERGIRALGGFEQTLARRSFLNDMLIAATCRSVGATLITANRADYTLIDRVVGFRFATSFPT